MGSCVLDKMFSAEFFTRHTFSSGETRHLKTTKEKKTIQKPVKPSKSDITLIARIPLRLNIQPMSPSTLEMCRSIVPAHLGSNTHTRSLRGSH